VCERKDMTYSRHKKSAGHHSAEREREREFARERLRKRECLCVKERHDLQQAQEEFQPP